MKTHSEEDLDDLFDEDEEEDLTDIEEQQRKIQNELG